MASADTWAEAVAQLSSKEREQLKIAGVPGAHVLKDVLAVVEAKKDDCAKRHLKFMWHGKPIILRDIFSKIAAWVQRFVEVGDVAIQYDPGHAALPWAAVRFILLTSIADTELFGVIMQDTATITNIIVRCTIQEKLYAGKALSTRDRLNAALKEI